MRVSASDGVLAAVLRLDRRHRLRIELVVDVADDLLEHVLDRREARDAAVLVDDDGHVIAAFTKLRQQRVQALALRNERGGAQEAMQVERRFVRDEVLQQVLREHDADDLVAIVADHGEARMVRLRDDLPHFVGRLILRDDDHLAARDHDVADLRVRDLEHALQASRTRRRR